jgi:Zn finger protein HypA/HybF involved in hydrogenase expression
MTEQQKPEITAACQQCGARLTSPLPDGWETPEGGVIWVKDLPPEAGPMVARVLREFLEAQPCPACGQTQLRVREG